MHTSLLEAQIALMDFQAARYLVEGEVPQQSGNDHPYVTPMGVIATQDGYLNLGVGGDGQWQALCQALDRPDWAADASLATDKARFTRRADIWAMLRPIFLQRTSQEWIARLDSFGVPAGPIYRMDEVFADAQVQHLGLATPVVHPVRGKTLLVGQPVTLSRTPAQLVEAAPDAGQHTDEVLREFGLTDDSIAALRAARVI